MTKTKNTPNSNPKVGQSMLTAKHEDYWLRPIHSLNVKANPRPRRTGDVITILDFTHIKLQYLENDVGSTFPHETYPQGILHMDLLEALSFRLINNGWEKKELLEMFAEMVDDSIDNLVEFEKEKGMEQERMVLAKKLCRESFSNTFKKS